MSDRLRQSLLFVPAVMLIGVLVIGFALDWLDGRLTRLLPQRLAFAPDVAVLLLSTIAGATITTAGVVFSLLVVSLQLASGQFSPRVLRRFWRDRFSHVLIGLLLATFAFCVLALARVNTHEEIAPPYTVLFALLLTVASVIVIVVYLDRIILQQYVGDIMHRVLEETLRLIAELPYGPHIGERRGKPVSPPDPDTLGPSFVVPARINGWVQQISTRSLLATVPAHTVVRVETRVGAYLTLDTPLLTLWPPPPPDQRERIGRLAARSMIVATSRSMQQDIDFGIRQLNDIALRALSDDNDATTAVEAVARLGSLMRPLLLASLPARSVEDDRGRILLTLRDPDHATYVRHAFAQLHVYAARHPQVSDVIADTIRMLQMACEGLPGREAARAELDRQLTITLANLTD
ncbi:DUF2254 domain-containing protein [Phytohabitans flavus]|uniref:DUF2254 domain-containing protein n=1 Tax=Phytohabitans flavus TaxID=1076124 RepID=UPI003631F9F8